jgi:hypothetical protein
MLTLVSAAAVLLASVIASTHSHFGVRGADEVSIESFCPCSFHSESGHENNENGTPCLVCKLLAEFNPDVALSFDFTHNQSVSSFDHFELAEDSTRPIWLFRGRAPPAV